MRRPLFIVFMFFFIVLTHTDSSSIDCSNVLKYCQTQIDNIPWCVENKMRNCRRLKSRTVGVKNPDLYVKTVNSASAATEVNTQYGHVINIPSEAIVRSTGRSKDDVNLIVSVLNHSLFQAPSDQISTHEQVLGVWLGTQHVNNLSHPVRIIFANVHQGGKCVFWKLSNISDQGRWSTDGCRTNKNNTDFICECNHLSFFAVLISPDEPDAANINHLQSISYIGSSFSVLFTAIILITYPCLRKSKAIIIHLQLTGSLFLLHLFFLASSFWSGVEGTACQLLGLSLHWALLATFTWTAIEGFHLYLLLVFVFNINISRYLHKLSLVGWGVPTVAVIICGVTGSYGKFTLMHNDSSLCWVLSEIVRYITVNSYLGLVLLFNITILVLMVTKLRKLRERRVQHKNKVRRFWKDWVSLLGLSCVLGLPWGLAFFTHGGQSISLIGIYLFTILNAFQGVQVFLWFLSITCKTNCEKQQSTKDSSMSHLSS